MAKAKKRLRYAFTVEVNGKQYQCERIVEGIRTLTQSISVVGMGSENDQASYGTTGHPVVSMPGVAKLIAQNIIKKAGG